MRITAPRTPSARARPRRAAGAAAGRRRRPSGTCDDAAARDRGRAPSISRRREVGAGEHGARRAHARRHQEAPAEAVHGREVVGRGEEGHVVDGGHARHVEGKRAGVGGGEEDVDAVRARPRAARRALRPPERRAPARAQRPRHDRRAGAAPGRRAPRRRSTRAAGPVAVARPDPQQVAQVASGARGPSRSSRPSIPIVEEADQAPSTRR